MRQFLRANVAWLIVWIIKDTMTRKKVVMEHLIVLIIQMKIIVTATYMHAQNVCNTFIIFT